MITFIELIKNVRYRFWTYSFTRCAPEIERVFDTVARSCMGNGNNSEEQSESKGLGGGMQSVISNGPLA